MSSTVANLIIVPCHKTCVMPILDLSYEALGIFLNECLNWDESVILAVLVYFSMGHVG